MEKKHIIKIWDANEYNYQDAKESGAVTIIEVPESLTSSEAYHFINGVEAALREAGKLTGKDFETKPVTLYGYRVQQEILEINRYSGIVFAESREDLNSKMQETDVIGHGDYELIEWGVSSDVKLNGKWSMDE